MKVILLLTACVKPNCNDILTIKDYVVRREQYLSAITWYLLNTPYKLVFCENSGTDISGLIDAKYNNRIEFVTFNSPNTNDLSKSYKEMEIIEYAYKHSIFIQESNLFVKITGRLILKNITQIVLYLEHKIKNYSKPYICSCLGARNLWSDSRFFFFTYPVFEKLIARKKEININFEFERALGTIIYEERKINLTFIYPPSFLRVSGVGGGFGCTYDISNFTYFVKNIKHKCIKILFDIHLLPKFKKSQIQVYSKQKNQPINA